MPFLALPQEAKVPFAQVLPDGRKRLTRYIQATTVGIVPPEVDWAVKHVDPWPAAQTPSGWTGLLLTYKQFEDQLAQRGADTRPIVQLIFEQISSTGETQTGGVPLTQLPDGRHQAVYTYVMFSSSTYTPLVPGTASVTIGANTYYLWEETNTNDGTLRNITRTYQTAGTVKTTNETDYNGALLKQTITTFKTVPATPSNYTAVGQVTQNPNGYPIYDYSFVSAAAAAGAGGEISREFTDAQGGTTPFNPSSPNSSVGSVRCTIRYLTDPSVSSNPITGPTSFVLVGLDKISHDGYIEWVGTYGFGAGLVVDDATINSTGTLVIYHRVQFGSAPSTPSATIGGTVTLFDTQTRNDSGYIIYDYKWAEGNGESAREFTNAQGGTTAFNPALPTSGVGSVLCTITYFSATSVTSDPTTGPASFVRIAVDFRTAGGYKIWTVKYAYGSGLVLDESTISETGGLVLYHRVSLGSAPSTPSATIGGTVTLFDSGTRNDSGYVIYDYRWAEGDGEVTRQYTNSQGGPVSFNPASPGSGVGNVVCTIVYFTATSVTSNPTSAPTADFYLIDIKTDLRNGYKVWTVRYGYGSGLILDETIIQATAALVIYHRVAFGAAPSTPSATIGGTVTLFETSVRKDNGFSVYDYRWSEGDGQASITTQGQQDGALDYRVVTYTAASSTPSYPGGGTGYLISLDNTQENGYFRNTALWRKPPATQTFRKKISFTKPGSVSISGSPLQLVFSSPVTMDILSEVEVSYAETQITDAPFTVESYADYYETYTPTDTGITVANTKSFGGYLGGASGTSGTNSVFNGILCDSWEYQLGSSTPSSFSLDEKVLDVDNDPYLVATDGTVVFRRTKVSYDFS